MVERLFLGWLVLSGGFLLFFLASAIVFRWMDGRRVARGDKRLLHDIAATDTLTRADLADLYRQVEEAEEAEHQKFQAQAKDPVWIREGIEALSIFATWKQRREPSH